MDEQAKQRASEALMRWLESSGGESGEEMTAPQEEVEEIWMAAWAARGEAEADVNAAHDHSHSHSGAPGQPVAHTHAHAHRLPAADFAYIHPHDFQRAFYSHPDHSHARPSRADPTYEALRRDPDLGRYAMRRPDSDAEPGPDDEV